ncbi:MAG TPA: hypothetical protein VKA70_13280 [Blastocatellia bacterium]|nr:hypothetical protein [Blastocatellia bacterium]
MPKQLNCSSCGAPLDPKTGALTTQCPYCGNRLVLPESSQPRGAHISFHVAHNQGKKSSAVAWVVGIIIGVVVMGGLIVAFGGLAVYFAAKPAPSVAPVSQPAPAIPAIPAPPSARPAVTAESNFASVAMEFGSEGIGAGQFKDARAVAVDGEGRIYVGEYSGGRVQVFDAEGKFLTQWMVDSERVLLNLAADRKGTVYAVHTNAILRYEGPTGRPLGEIPKSPGARYENYSDAYVALDGSLYVIGTNDNILRISPEGEVRTVVDTREKVGERLSLDKLAVDGTGTVYALDRMSSMVFKFSPDGRFVNRFGGRGEKPGQLFSPHNIATDGQGRVYVSDTFRAVHVFDGNGLYLDSFGGGDVTFGIAINDKNEIFTSYRNRHKIVKFVPKKS